MKQRKSIKRWQAGGFVLLALLPLWRPAVCYAGMVVKQPSAVVTAAVTGWCRENDELLAEDGIRLHDGALVYMDGKGILTRPVALPDAVLVRPVLEADFGY